jgi:peptidoglycan hydrolase CwlO-like protein
MARKIRFTGSPINARQEELSQQAQALEREMARCKRLIAEAPQRVKEAEERREQERLEQNERRRQQVVLRANTGRSPFDASDVLHGTRDGEESGAERPTKPRRAQRRAAQTQLAVMLVAVMVAGAFVLFLLIQLIQHLG